MYTRLAFALSLLAVCCFGGQQQFTGPVYSDHSGPSAHGAGYVVLATSKGLARIHYAKPIRARFLKERCWELGAIWTVSTRQIDGEHELMSAHCSGRMDRSVHSAWSTVLQYVAAVAEKVGYKVGYQQGRRGPVFLNMAGLRVEASGYLQFVGNGMCLEVSHRISDEKVVIASSADCYLDPHVAFTVERSASSVWKVSGIQRTDSTP